MLRIDPKDVRGLRQCTAKKLRHDCLQKTIELNPTPIPSVLTATPSPVQSS